MPRRFLARLGAAFSVAALVLSMGAGAVLAGEITGNGRSLQPMHGKSLCAFSGLNDKITAEEPGRTQSYGQLVRAGYKDFYDNVLGASPGVACNPTKGFHP